MGKMPEWLFHFVWDLHDRSRAGICITLGVGVAVLDNQLLGWKWETCFLSGWILGLGGYLVFLGIVIVSADGPMTQQRVSKDEPNRMALMVLIVFLSIFGTGIVGVLLTAVGKHSLGHSRLLLSTERSGGDVVLVSTAHRLWTALRPALLRSQGYPWAPF